MNAMSAADDRARGTAGTAGFDPDAPLGPALREAFAARLQRFERRPLAEGSPLSRAAVTLTLVEEGDGADVPGLARPAGWSRRPALLLTRRAGHLRRHAGQWALPGGRIDADEDPVTAARRELLEEVGLAVPDGDILGALDDYATRSGWCITPIVVWGGVARDLRPDPGEVASIHRIALAELLRADAPILEPSAQAPQPVLKMPVGSRWIAAPTAAFMLQLREVLLCDRPTRVAHYDQPRFAWR